MTKPQKISVSEILRLRKLGYTFSQIAKKLGYTRFGISKALKRAREKGEVGVGI